MQITINGRFLCQPVTGVQRYAREFVKALDRLLVLPEWQAQGWQVELLTPHRPIAHPLSLKQIHCRAVGRLSGHAWEQIDLPRAARGLLFCPGNTAPVLALLGRQQTVVTVHCLSFRYFPSAYAWTFRLFYRLLTPMIMRYADAVLTVSEAEQQSILKHYPQVAGRLHAVHNGGLADDQRVALPSPLMAIESAGGLFEDLTRFGLDRVVLARPFVLAVGSLSRRKNLQGILAATTLVNQTHSVDVVFVGANSQVFSRMRLDVSDAAQQRLHFLGQINDVAVLIELYRRAVCLVFPSWYESSGLPPMEAMACGCPVIVSDLPVLQERCGDAALYCSPGDASTIAAQMVRLLDSESLRSQLRAAGLKRAQRYTWRNCVIDTLKVLQASSARSSGASP